ncbi:hypothetical protein SODALDRAFT_335541 [Sodiomyces alkalinus F11]|uniref:EthD domain-containing protein n=1 Tax=Sodiomyces alkalinus (strain CBS 110278 / VKM F-3762 / F11) TaxID=1314773 RepID=A0A3N2PPK2_SODAK|nr:hypothetical protein SODALDRAFT_335541 [Sodiomyces alkalinus F11]ROT36441.1 hypothetical protein SODALDRAFT_335541 [Sodiomyces alkalinus F11]
MASRDVLKVSALHYKDASKTDEEFEKHVHENINPAWVQLVKRHGVFKYAVAFCPSIISAKLAEKVEKTRPGWTVISSHAVLTYWVRDIEHMLALTADEGYKELGRTSEVGWIDSTKGEVMVGYERVYIENGEILD